MSRVIGGDSILGITGGVGVFVNEDGWNDIVNTFFSAKGRGTAEPTWKDMGNGIYGFSFAIGDELFLYLHVPHDYIVGTNGFIHIHFLVTDALSLGDYITWEVEYSVARGHHQGDRLTNGSQIIDLTYTADGTEITGEHLIIEATAFQTIDLKEPDSLVVARVKLKDANVSAEVFGLMCDIHYRSDGSTTKYKEPPFND